MEGRVVGEADLEEMLSLWNRLVLQSLTGMPILQVTTYRGMGFLPRPEFLQAVCLCNGMGCSINVKCR